MRHSKLQNELKLILLLADNMGYTATELSEKMEVSRRHIYYLLEFIESAGFILFKRNNKYHLDRRSPFFTELTETLQFSDAEIRTIYNILLMAGDGSETVNQLRAKLDRAYNFSERVLDKRSTLLNNNLKLISEAIHTKKMVKFVGYSSPHSHTVSDRIVEPFLLMNDNQDVRCHEIKTGMNKTFRINRIKTIEKVDTPWIYEEKHRQIFTDIFMFSGEEHHRVKLKLGQLSYNIFMEEYSQGAKYIQPLNSKEWLLDIEVCDFRGLGRFVLGLYSDIEIVENNKFKAFINEILQKYIAKSSTE